MPVNHECKYTWVYDDSSLSSCSGQSFFPKCISAWNGLAEETAEANTLDLFKSKVSH